MKVKWIALWMKMFGKTKFLGLNMGFGVSMVVGALIVIIMISVFFSMKPQRDSSLI